MHPLGGFSRSLDGLVWQRPTLILLTAVREQSCLLAERYDPIWPALHCFIERSPRNPVITGKRDQLLDVRVRVVPKLDGVRKIERPPHSHDDIVERNRNAVERCEKTFIVACRSPRPSCPALFFSQS